MVIDAVAFSAEVLLKVIVSKGFVVYCRTAFVDPIKIICPLRFEGLVVLKIIHFDYLY